MCAQSSADINHIHKRRGRLSNVGECVLFPRSAKVIQKVNVKGGRDPSAWGLKLPRGPRVNPGTEVVHPLL